MIPPRFDVIVVGGGPAGASAAIHVAGHGRSILVLEKDVMPRDKLCGEFHSTEVTDLSRRLGVLDRLYESGAVPIEWVRATSAHGRSFTARLPGTAFGLSRKTFDYILLDRARKAGAEVREGCEVRDIRGDLKVGFEVITDAETFRARVVLGAYGRRSQLDRKLDRRFLQAHSPYVAFKAHYTGALPEAFIELHAFRGGYCGLLREENGKVNACWIADAKHLRTAGGSPGEMVANVLRLNPMLSERLDSLDSMQEFLAVGQLSFRPKDIFAGDVCMIGDAAGMIAPLCGDGMAMALATGEMVAPIVNDFLTSRASGSDFKSRYEAAWRASFTRRMGIGRFIHSAYSRSPLSSFGVFLCAVSPRFAGTLLRATRG